MLYDVKEIELIQQFSQATVTERMRRNCSMECSLISCHNVDDQIALLVASDFNNG